MSLFVLMQNIQFICYPKIGSYQDVTGRSDFHCHNNKFELSRNSVVSFLFNVYRMILPGVFQMFVSIIHLPPKWENVLLVCCKVVSRSCLE